MKVNYVITLGGTSLKFEELNFFLSELSKCKNDIWIIYRNDLHFYKELVEKYKNIFKTIIETFDVSLKKIGKIKEILNFIPDDILIKFLDPDDLVNISIKEIEYKNFDLISVSMIGYPEENRKNYFEYNYVGTNPSSIYLSNFAKKINKFNNLKYDSVFFEDMYRFLMTTLAHGSNPIILKENYLFGAYKYHGSSYSEELFLRKEKGVLRAINNKAINKKDIECILLDVYNNRSLFNNEILKNWYVRDVIKSLIKFCQICSIDYKKFSFLIKLISEIENKTGDQIQREIQSIIDNENKLYNLYNSNSKKYIYDNWILIKKRRINSSNSFKKNLFLKEFKKGENKWKK